MSALRVAIADDSALMRQGVARVLEDAGFEVVAQVENAVDLMHAVGSLKPDVAVVDIRMPPTHTDEGVRAARRIREAHPGVGGSCAPTRASAPHRRAARVLEARGRRSRRRAHRMTPGQSRGGLHAWAGAALVRPGAPAFGLLRPDDGSVPFFVLLALAAVGYLATLYQVAKGLRPSGPALIACAALALAWRVPMLLAPPEPAADLRRYLWDAHLVRAGFSPYAVVPADPAFAHLRTDETWPVNNPDVPSPYPPGAQLFFLAATALGESARAIKLAALLCDALLALVVWRSLVVAGANPGWMLAYLWSPLVSLEVARHGHLDVAGALLVALAALALVRGRALAGTVALALSIAVKPLSLVLLPLLWRRVSRWHVVAASAVAAARSLPFWDRRRPPLGSVPEVIDRFRFNGPIFSGVASLAGPPAATGFAVVAGLAVAILARRRLSLASPAGVGLADGGDAPLRAAGLSLVPRLARSVPRRTADDAADDLDGLDPEHLRRVATGRRALGRARLGAGGRVRRAARRGLWLWRRYRATRPTSVPPTCPTPPASPPRS